jgi:isoamylase
MRTPSYIRLGARPGSAHAGGGTFFRVAAPDATAVSVCVDGHDPVAMQKSGATWFGHVADAGPGAHYGYRARGPGTPDSAPLVLDPYARRVVGDLDRAGEAAQRGEATLRSVVLADEPVFAWREPYRRRVQDTDRIVQEVHVRGYTMRAPWVAAEDRGTFRALGHAETIAYLRDLGVNTLLLMPIHASVTEPRLAKLGLRNHWGYSPVSYFALNPRYARPDEAPELSFAHMVDALHAAGIEVIVDVVYNHTAELGMDGPCLSFRGLSPATYYMMDGERYIDRTGCGNTVRAAHPVTLQLILDSLRYLADDLHVDGFRLDLGVTLGAAEAGKPNAFAQDAPFFAAIAADPVLSTRSWMTEPWDAAGSYQLGRFPNAFLEWNDRFRDDVRQFFMGDARSVPALADALAGSSVLFERDTSGNKSGRTAHASVNYVGVHDGFTLWDQVCYARKHNEANGENNRDGPHDTRVECFGVEGESDDPAVMRARIRKVRSLMALVLLSKGTPMFGMADERGRSQNGNSNAYCQDGESTWVDWEREVPSLRSALRELLNLRALHPQIRSGAFYCGAEETHGHPVRWWHPDGREMSVGDWQRARLATLGLQVGDELLILLNGDKQPQPFCVPPQFEARRMRFSADPSRPASDAIVRGALETLEPHCVYVAVAANLAQAPAVR